MWPFKKKRIIETETIDSSINIYESKILHEVEECDIKWGDDNYEIELGGMFCHNQLHGYGYYVNHRLGQVAFGIFDDGSLKRSLFSEFQEIQGLIGNHSRMTALGAFGCGVFIGEALSPAAREKDETLRKNRYGILILEEGLYIGSFPPGFYLARCEGKFFNLDGIMTEGVFDIKVKDQRQYGDDSLGSFFPSY